MKFKTKCPKSTNMLTIFVEHGITAHPDPKSMKTLELHNLSNDPVLNTGNDYCFSSGQKTIHFD